MTSFLTIRPPGPDPESAAVARATVQAALGRLRLLNPDPRDGEASYLLGLTLRLAGRSSEADDAFGKAAWDGAFGAAADTARAEIAALEGRSQDALALLERALAANAAEPLALGLRAALLYFVLPLTVLTLAVTTCRWLLRPR